MSYFKNTLCKEAYNYLNYRALNNEHRGKILALNCSGRIKLAYEGQEDWRADIKNLCGIEIDESDYVDTDTIKKYVVFARRPRAGFHVMLFGNVIANIDSYGTYITLYNDTTKVDDTDENASLRKLLLSLYLENGVVSSIMHKIYAELENDLLPNFYSWDGSDTIDLRDKFDITVDRLTQVEFYDSDTMQYCVKYMPELKPVDGSKFAVIRVNGKDHLVMPRDGWIIFALAPSGINTNTTQDETAALIQEYTKHPYNNEI